MANLVDMETEADTLELRLATLRSDISKRWSDLCANLQAEAHGLQSKADKLNDELVGALQRAQTAEDRAEKMNEDWVAALQRARTVEERVKHLNDDLVAALQRALTAEERAENLNDDLVAALQRAQTAEDRAETPEFHVRERGQRAQTRLQVLQIQMVEMQQEIRDEREKRQVAEDKLKDLQLQLEAWSSSSPQGSAGIRSARPSSSHNLASETEGWKKIEHWGRRITELVQAHPQGIHINSLWWHWTQKYPDENPNEFRPVAKLKNAVRNYVDTVYVDAQDKVHLLRGRSRSPRRSSALESI